MRVDRALTLFAARPLLALLGRGASGGIPILMYHSVAPDIDDTLSPYYRTVTSPSTFERQVEHLRAGGYRSLTLSQALRRLREGTQGAMPTSRCVVITFDDGFKDFRDEAFPILQRAGFTATVFLATDFVGRAFLTGRPCLSGSEVRELSRAGVEFGSHSASHRRLVDLPNAELADEVRCSKAAIEDLTGSEVTTFSYPFRFPSESPDFVRRLGDLLADSGYLGGVTTTIGRAGEGDDPLFLPRLPINDCDDEALLRAKLEGHYDWLRAGQSLRKRSRAAWHRWVGA